MPAPCDHHGQKTRRSVTSGQKLHPRLRQTRVTTARGVSTARGKKLSRSVSRGASVGMVAAPLGTTVATAALDGEGSRTSMRSAVLYITQPVRLTGALMMAVGLCHTHGQSYRQERASRAMRGGAAGTTTRRAWSGRRFDWGRGARPRRVPLPAGRPPSRIVRHDAVMNHDTTDWVGLSGGPTHVALPMVNSHLLPLQLIQVTRGQTLCMYCLCSTVCMYSTAQYIFTAEVQHGTLPPPSTPVGRGRKAGFGRPAAPPHWPLKGCRYGPPGRCGGTRRRLRPARCPAQSRQRGRGGASCPVYEGVGVGTMRAASLAVWC